MTDLLSVLLTFAFAHSCVHVMRITCTGITLLECATGAYPYLETGTYIEMVQTVLESPEPSLPPNTEGRRWSNELREFCGSCVHKNPKERVPADILLGSPWFRQWGATDLQVSVELLRNWIGR